MDRIHNLSYLTALMSFACCTPQTEATGIENIFSYPPVVAHMESPARAFIDSDKTQQEDLPKLLKSAVETLEQLARLCCISKECKKQYSDRCHQIREFIYNRVKECLLKTPEKKKEIVDILVDYARYFSFKEILTDILLGGSEVKEIQNMLNRKLADALLQQKPTEHIIGLIHIGADVNKTHVLGQTTLIYAASKGHVEVVEALITAGANVHEKSQAGHTALMLAALYGHIEVVELLINVGAGVHEKNIFKQTALTLAAANGHVEVVEALIAAGVDVHAKSESGKTALMLASSYGHVEVVELLEEAAKKQQDSGHLGREHKRFLFNKSAKKLSKRSSSVVIFPKNNCSAK